MSLDFDQRWRDAGCPDTALTKPERAALLKCRYAGRFDDRYRGQAPETADARSEEQCAAWSRVDRGVYRLLEKRGLIEWRNGFRLTDAGSLVLEMTHAEP